MGLYDRSTGQPASPFLAAMLIDPRFKDTYFNVHESASAKRVILDFLCWIQDSATINMTALSAYCSTDNIQSELETSETSDAQEEEALWAAHDSQPAIVDPSQHFDTNSITDAVWTAVDQLSKGTASASNDHGHAYWHCSQYPLLEAAAHKYCLHRQPAWQVNSCLVQQDSCMLTGTATCSARMRKTVVSELQYSFVWIKLLSK